MIEFWKVGIRDNTGLPFHIIGGKFFQWIAVCLGADYIHSLAAVLIVAVLWEFYEALQMAVVGWDLSLAGKKYGTTKNFLLDALGDILGALIGAL